MLALKLVNLVSLYLSLALFELLPVYWSLEYVSLCKSHLRAVFQPLANAMGTPLSGTAAPGWGTWCGAETLRSSGGTSKADLSFLFINHLSVGTEPV